MTATILVVDDDKNIRLSLRFLFENNQYRVLEAEHPRDAVSLLAHENIDLIMLDMNFRNDTTSCEEGLKFLDSLTDSDTPPVVAMTAWADVNIVVKAMHNGAGDFIEKPWSNNRLLKVVEQQLTIAQLGRKSQGMQQLLASDNQAQFQWQSECMQSLFADIENVALSDASILLTGENGTGKSTIANWIHNQSQRQQQNFVVVNVGAIPNELFESEMFGHKKGAFTGAIENRIGRFEMAHNGSLFLDEVATLGLSQQAKLLRVLETGEYEVVGESQTRRCDLRLISASNCDFADKIAKDEFRQDLYYRLNTLILHVPPLRERKADLIPLVEFFAGKFAKKYQKAPLQFEPSALHALSDYDWPGNVRECSHVIERAVLLNKGQPVTASSLKLFSQISTSTEELLSLEESEKQLILKALEMASGNVQQASVKLGITSSSLYRRIDKFGLNVKS